MHLLNYVLALLTSATLPQVISAQAISQPTATRPIVDAEGFPSTDTEILDGKADTARRMTLPVMIGGAGPFDFLVDTGAQATVLSRELGEELQLPSDGRATLVGIASRSTVELVQLDGLELGNRTIDGLTAPVLERRHLGADGILGLDSLQDLRVLLDFRDNTMAVTRPPENRSGDRFEIVVRARSKLGRLIVTDAEIDGITTVLIVDTGSQASIGNARLQQRLRSTSNVDVTGRDVTGARIDAYLDTVSELRIGTVALNGIPIAFSDALVFSELGLENRPALILGMQDLRLFDRVAIDFAKNRIMFDLPRRLRRGSSTILLAKRGRI